jgi:hypothetical protein
MSKRLLILLLFVSFLNVKAQVDKDTIDSKYLEDQIYVSMVYNILHKLPTDFSQNGFSGGLAIGFIKDLPINKQRNKGFGIGLGYSYGVFIQNLKITQENGTTQASIASNYNVNRFRVHSMEMPLEFRWRNSTETKYKFWRVYGGVKVMYAFAYNSTYKDDLSTETTKNITEYNKFQSGAFISAGYSTWNLYIYYGFNPLFKNLKLDGKDVDMKEINVGLKYYIM